jgi:molybdopterin molybdotransferase
MAGRDGAEGKAPMSAMISVEEALKRVLASAEAPLGEEKVALQAAYGRVLAYDLKALRTQPPFPNSAMDGYALRAGDTASAHATLTLVGESAAGRAFDGVVGPGEAVRIFTGAPMPDGADAVVIQEDVQREGEQIRVSAPVRAGDNLRPAGMDFQAGQTLIAAGQRLTPRDVALAAAANHTELTVRRRARVAILATGDELVPPGGALGPAQIVASNNFAVTGLVDAYGGVAIDLGIAIDDLDATKAAIAQARDAKADVLVTLGGASVGDYDLVQQALVSSGMELGFWRIAMRPGKPLMHGRLGPTRVLGLPGNPTSSMVCSILFLRPLLRALHGEPDPGADPSQPGRLAVDLPANGVRQDYMRALLSRSAEGILVATPVSAQDSSLVRMMAGADGLIVRASHAEPAKAGEACRVIAFHGLGV